MFNPKFSNSLIRDKKEKVDDDQFPFALHGTVCSAGRADISLSAVG